MAWKKTKITNNAGKTVTVWKNSKGQISYSNPKAVSAAKKALQVSGVAKGLSGIRDTASFVRASLKSGGGSRPGQFLGGDLTIPKDKEKADLSPEANKARILAEKNRITQAENEAKLEGLRIDRRSGNNIRTGTRNWSNPYMGPEYEESARLRKKAEADTKKYQEDKFDAEIAASRAEDSLQHRIEAGKPTAPGMYEWTTDQGVDEAGKLTEKVDPIKTKKTSSKKSGGGSSSGTSGELGREEWLKKTANSPAARAGMSDEMRWQARQNHLEFLRKRKNKKKLSIKD